MKFFSLLIFAFLLNSNTPVAVEKKLEVLPAATQPAVLMFQDVESESDEKLTLLTLKFSKKISFPSVEVEDQGSFLQLTFAGVVFPKSGTFFDVNSPYFTKWTSVQSSETDGSIRIFSQQKASLLKKSSKVDILGDRIVITLDHAQLAQIIGTEKKSAEVKPAVVETVAAKKIEEAKIASVPVNDALLQKNLPKVAIFLVALMGLGLALVMMRPLLRKVRSRQNFEDELKKPTFQIVSSLALTPKNKIHLVQVLDQFFMVTINKGEINFLTQVTSPVVQAPLALPQPVEKQAARFFSGDEIPMLRNPKINSAKKNISAMASDEVMEANRMSASKSDKVPPKNYDELSKMIREKLKKIQSERAVA